MGLLLVDCTAGRHEMVCVKGMTQWFVKFVMAVLCLALHSNCLAAQEVGRDGPTLMSRGVELLLDQKYEELNSLFDLVREAKQLSYGGNSMQEILTNGVGGVNVSYDRVRGALDDRLQLLLAWYRKAPSVGSLTCIAQCYLSQAWNARGTGLASSINSDAGFRMDSALNSALEALNEAEELASKSNIKDASIYDLKMSVGHLLGDTRKEMLDNLKLCLDIDPWYLSSVRTMCNYLLPRWHGNEGDLVRFANAFPGSRLKESGMAAYAQVAISAYNSSEINSFSEAGFEWNKVKQGLLAHLDQSPDSVHLLERGAYFGHVALDRPFAREMLERLQGRSTNYYFTHPVFTERTVRWAFDNDAKGDAYTSVEYGPYPVGDFSIGQSGTQIATPIRSRLIRINDLETGKSIGEIKLWPASLFVMSRKEVNGKTDLVVRNEAEIELRRYDLKTEDYRVLGTSAHGVQQVVTSEDGTGVAIVDQTNSVKFWRVEEQALPYEWLKVFEKKINALAISSDASRVAAAEGRTIKLWDTTTRELVRSWDAQTNSVLGLAFSSDGKTLASTGHGGELLLWSTEDFKEIGRVSTDLQWGMSLDISPDGRHVVVGAYNERAIPQPSYMFIVDIESKSIVKKMLAHRNQILSVAFTPDGSKVVTAGNDGSVRVWSMP